MDAVRVDSEFAARLRDLRSSRGLSQRTLAQAISTRQGDGADKAFVSMLERGLRAPSETTLAKLAAVLGVTSDWLATGREDRLALAIRDARDAGTPGELDEAWAAIEEEAAKRWPSLFAPRPQEGL